MNVKVLSLCLNGDTAKQIAKKLNLPIKRVVAILDNYVRDGKLALTRTNQYKEVKTGALILKPDGYGFIRVEGEEQDYFVPVGCTADALDKDIVNFYVFSEGKKLQNAEIIKVLERGTKFICGKVNYKRKGKALKAYVQTKAEGMLHMIRLDDVNEYEEGTIVKVELRYLLNQIRCRVVEVIGKNTDKGIAISEIAANYGFHFEFSDETNAELASVSDIVEDKYLKGRTDFTNKLIITIDGDDAKDFDDAISLTRLANGNYELGVYIADVSNYVVPNTSLNDEAMHRGTSVYLADRVIPMLPFKLSNGLCSLNEGVTRLVMACTMEIDNTGQIVNHVIEEGYIKSAHRMTYNSVNKIIAGDPSLCQKYSNIVEMISQMNTLAHILRNKRHTAGGLDFEIDEYKVELNEMGEPVDVILRQRGKAERLIEDFMLAANGCVAFHLSSLNMPCMYRVHEKPDQEKLRDVFKIVGNMGVAIKLPKNDIHSKLIQKALEELQDNPLEPIINQLILRSMMKAKYTTKNLGHYGLCMEYYCHFTSPIRRYPDLMVHRILKELILHPIDFNKRYAYYENQLENIAILNSNSERKAIDCEREVDNMMKAWYMSYHLKEQFEGIVVGIMNFGMFIALKNGVEGMVSVKTMDGYFDFDDKKQTLTDGTRTYTLGDKVEVIVMYASKEKSKVELVLTKDYYSCFGDDTTWK